jgi:uncharacterized membrane protein
MSTSLEILIGGSAVIIIVAIVFHRYVSKIPARYLLLFLAGALTAFGVKKTAEKVRDIHDKFL